MEDVFVVRKKDVTACDTQNMPRSTRRSKAELPPPRKKPTADEAEAARQAQFLQTVCRLQRSEPAQDAGTCEKG
jgi:hypothetical protein